MVNRDFEHVTRYIYFGDRRFKTTFTRTLTNYITTWNKVLFKKLAGA